MKLKVRKINVQREIQRLRAATGADYKAVMRDLMKTEGRLLVSSSGKTPGLVQVTAPFQAGKRGNAAKASGENAISADLLGYGKSGQRTRGIFVVMDAGLLAKNHRINSTGTIRLFVKKDGTVYGTDQAHYRPNASVSEMKAHHQSKRGANGRVTKAGAQTRDIGRWKFIEQMVVTRAAYLRYEKAVHKKVGMLAASIVASAEAKLGPLKGVPIWVRRHAAKGGGTVNLSESKLGYEVTVENSNPRMQSDLQRKFNYVLAYRLNALQKKLPFIVRSIEKKLAAQLKD
jgi:hypothetical protein